MRYLLLFCLLWTGVAAAAETPPTHEFTLDNGLHVLLREDHRAPVAVMMVWYKVGSYDEAPGQTGLAHLLEHMMFRGTKKVAPGDFSRYMARFGAEENAFTSYDYTAYFQKFEVSRLPLMLELEADRMHNLTIADKDFVRERGVVMEERRQRTDDNPSALAYEKFSALTRPGSGYASPVIGWRDEIQQLQPQQARNWYHKWYVPGNATLVIAGDLTLDQVKPMVEKFFNKVPAGTVPVRMKPRLASPPGDRRAMIRVPVKVPSVYIAWNVPTLATNTKDFYALMMLAGVLDGGYSARIESDLVRGSKLAASAGANYDGLNRGDGLLTMTATPVPGVSADRLEKALLAQVDTLRKTPPTKDEMARVRAGVLSGRIFDMDSLFGQAMELGQLATLGIDWHLADAFADNLEKVTPADVQRVAQQWLVAQRRTVAHIEPEAQP